MIGSPNAFYGGFDGDGSNYGFFPAPGSSHIEAQFENYFEDRNMTVQPTSFSNGTYYVDFVDLGIPVGGLYTGTPPQDNCYHLPCDNIDNINWEVLTLNTRVCIQLSTPHHHHRDQESFVSCRLSHTYWRAMQFLQPGFRRGLVLFVGPPPPPPSRFRRACAALAVWA